MSLYKLYYFNGRGQAEVSCLIFAAVGQKFEDILYNQNDWSSHKTKMSIGEMSVLQYDSVKLPQSLTIVRFPAKQFQLAGKDNFEQVKIDTIRNIASELVSLH